MPMKLEICQIKNSISDVANLRHISNNLFPTSLCTLATVSFSCFAIACPRKDSTLKLLVFAGNIINAITVASELAF